MPIVNTYFSDAEYLPKLEEITPGLKTHVAEQLTCKEIALDSREISVRLIQSLGEGMLADVELDIAAAPYPERVKKQDVICMNVRKFVLDHVEDLTDAKVWLALSELGHSWEVAKLPQYTLTKSDFIALRGNQSAGIIWGRLGRDVSAGRIPGLRLKKKKGDYLASAKIVGDVPRAIDWLLHEGYNLRASVLEEILVTKRSKWS